MKTLISILFFVVLNNTAISQGDWNTRSENERCMIATVVYYNAIKYVNELFEQQGPRYIHESHLIGPRKDMERLCGRRLKCGQECQYEQILNGEIDLYY